MLTSGFIVSAKITEYLQKQALGKYKFNNFIYPIDKNLKQKGNNNGIR